MMLDFNRIGVGCNLGDRILWRPGETLIQVIRSEENGSVVRTLQGLWNSVDYNDSGKTGVK